MSYFLDKLRKERDYEEEYQTEDDTATTADNDYQSANSSIMIPAGQTQGTITIRVDGDTKLESDETFFVNITSATNATIGDDGQADGTIDNDDTPPSLTIDDVSTTPFTFTIHSSFAYSLVPLSTSQLKIE